MEEVFELTEVIRQIEGLQRQAGRFLEMAYRSQDGKGNVNEGLLQQGQVFLQRAEALIQENIVPILQSLNPSQVASSLAAAGASPALISEVTPILNAARAVAAGGMSVAAICEVISVAVPVLLAVVGLAVMAFLYKMWLDRNIKKEGERLLKQYEDRVASRPRHVPFQPRFIPGRM